MPRSAASSRRTGRPPRTSRAQILESARRIIERDGWEKLTIRRLATEIGVSAMTLYHHVEDRGDLLVQLISDQIGQAARPDLPEEPRERILAAGIFIHDTLAQWPWVTEVVTTDGFISRLDDAALWPVEVIVAGAMGTGCSAEQAILVFRNLWYYTVGEMLVRTHTRSRRADDPSTSRDVLFTQPDPAIASHDPGALPHLVAVGTLWGEVAQRDTFASGLEALVDGLLAQAAGDRPG